MAKPPKKHARPGRPQHVPTEKTRTEVSALASFGITQPDIADYIGINQETLRKHYPAEISASVTRANAAMARRLFKAGEEGSVPAMIFWLKARAGWRERHEIDHSSSDGSMRPPTVIEIVAGK